MARTHIEWDGSASGSEWGSASGSEWGSASGSALITGPRRTGRTELLLQIARSEEKRVNRVFGFACTSEGAARLRTVVPRDCVSLSTPSEIDRRIAELGACGACASVVVDEWGAQPNPSLRVFAACQSYSNVPRARRRAFDLHLSAREMCLPLLERMRRDRAESTTLQALQQAHRALPEYAFLAARLTSEGCPPAHST